VASLVSPFGPLGMAGCNGRKAEALGRNRTFTVHAFFYFQKINFCLKFGENSYTFSKFIENNVHVKKIQNKFLENHFE
jgi:hypothetical protein